MDSSAGSCVIWVCCYGEAEIRGTPEFQRGRQPFSIKSPQKEGPISIVAPVLL